MVIDGGSPIPRYHQMKEIIRGMVASPNLSVGGGIPSERDLAKKYEISRGTVRRAISDLVAEGVLFPQRGKGTFIGEAQGLGSKNLSGLSKIIALVIPYIPRRQSMCSQILIGAEEAARLNGYYLIVSISNDDFNREKEIVRDLLETGVSGLIIYPAHPDFETDKQHIVELVEKEFPFILIDRFFRDLTTDYVVTDNEAGAYRAVTHLIELGHQRIGHITAPEVKVTSVEDRLVGYKKALIDHGLPFEQSLIGKTEGHQEGELRAFIREIQLPAAFFCLHDFLAIQTMKIIKEEGMKIPDDIAIVGYDDMEAFLPHDTGLTTVRQPFYEVGKTAVAKLLKKVRKEIKPETVQRVVLTSKLVIRESCGSQIMRMAKAQVP